MSRSKPTALTVARAERNLAQHLDYIEEIATDTSARAKLANPTAGQVQAWAQAARKVQAAGYRGVNPNMMRKLTGHQVALRTKMKIVHNASKPGSRGYKMLRDIAIAFLRSDMDDGDSAPSESGDEGSGADSEAEKEAEGSGADSATEEESGVGSDAEESEYSDAGSE